MKNNIVKQLKSVAKDTRLSATEKAVIKSQLLHYVKTHPAGSVASSYVHVSPSPFSIQNFRNKKTLSAFVIGGLLLGSSVSFASENTIPGDMLYPVKIYVNESARTVLAVTPIAKAEWEVRLAERRLEEVEKLAMLPGVSEESIARAENNFNKHTERIQEHIVKFEKNNDSENAVATAGKLTDMLRKHESTLDKKNFPHSLDHQRPAIISNTKYALESPVVEINISAESVLIDAVLDNVRDARGDAEKKQNELKEKYEKKEAIDHQKSNSGTPTKPESAELRKGAPREEFRAVPSKAENASRND